MLGWRTGRKLVVIESDDWGTIRMASAGSYNYFLKNHIPVDQCAYNRNDALESNDDLELLFEVLSSVKDSKGNHAIITANTVVANPDFQRIKNADFQQYFYEPFIVTLGRYPRHNRVEQLCREGIEKKIWYPQFHAREHINIHHWLSDLQNGDQLAQMVFDQQMFSVFKGNNSNCRNEYLDAFGTYSEVQLAALESILSEGLHLFKQIWGYNSKTLIAPCYIWHPKAEKYFQQSGIDSIQSGIAQKVPLFEEKKYKISRKYTGLRNQLNQLYTVRNAFFEPSGNPGKDWISSCLNDIGTAFAWHKPAIISSHRLNYIGSINSNNRSQNLQALQSLLNQIVKKWPEVEFVHSEQLLNIIKK
jgi:hypothetical protein